MFRSLLIRVIYCAVLSALGVATAPLARAQVSISAPPLDVTLTIGNSALLSVTAASSASASLQYQWRLNGVNIPGATTSAYSIGSAQAPDCGAYTVVVSDGITAVETRKASVTATNILESLLGGILNTINLTNLFQPVTSGVVRSANTNASYAPGEPAIIPGDPGGKPVWFSWTPQVSGIVTFDTRGSDFDTIMGAFMGSSPSNLTQVPSAVNDDDSGGFRTSKVSFNASALTQYYIGVDGYYGASGNIVLSWNETQTSDQLPSVTANPQVETTVSNNAPVTLTAGFTGGSSLWYFNGQPTTVTGAVYRITNVEDTNVGSYSLEIISPKGDFTNFTRAANVQINTLEDGSASTNSAAFNKFFDSVNSSFTPPLPAKTHVKLDGGDTSGFTTSQTFSTRGAQGEPGEPAVCAQIGGHPGWYVFVAPTNGALLVNTAGSDFNTILGVYTNSGPGNSFSNLVSIGCGFTTNDALDGQPSVYVAAVPVHQTNYIVVDGENGATGTAHLNISMGAPVTIASGPQSGYALPGSTIAFSVGASGAIPLSYSWQCDGTNIPNATNSTLTITNLRNAQLGTYSVLVTNLVSIASTSAVLSLGAAPAILTQPVSHTVTPGNTASLTVSASGSPPPAYQWQWNNTNIPASSSSLSLSNFQSSLDGSYDVIITNIFGSVTSSPTLLAVNSPLQISPMSWNKTSLQLDLTGVAGGNYVIQASTNLLDWQPLLTNNAPNGFLFYSETNFTSFPCRFFRAVTN